MFFICADLARLLNELLGMFLIVWFGTRSPPAAQD
jgi:hypothetical protein